MNIINLIKYQSGKRKIAIKDNENIVVMSFNIRTTSKKDTGEKDYHIRMPLIRKLLEEENPDVIGFQEVKVIQFEYLCKVLKDYGYVYQRRDKRPGGEANPVFFKLNRFKLLGGDTFWLSDTYQVMSNTFNGDCFRICTYVLLEDSITHKKLYVFNTHLDHINEEARIKGIQLIKRRISEINVENIPYIITGDMNDFYHSKTIDALFKDLKDASLFNNQKDLITFHDYGRDTQKIDYIALSNNINQVNYKVVTTTYNNVFPSDHYPIEVFIKL